MDLYGRVSADISRLITEQYSTSFSMASRLFASSIRQDIYNIYGFVRIADEVVDTYSGKDAAKLIDDLEVQLASDLNRGYSTNPVLHSFVISARQYAIGMDLVTPFMDSMRIDAQNTYTTEQYQTYIYGSAEVVGLMCLKVFCGSDSDLYKKLQPAAKALGAAFQKVNFLRDMAEDQTRLGRYYFPVGSFAKFDESVKAEIIADIRQDFAQAQTAFADLPVSARQAVRAAFEYYMRLLAIIENTPAEKLKVQRVRVPDWQKVALLAKTKARR